MDETADREFLTPEEVRGVYDIEDRKQQLRSLVRLLIPYYDFSARRDLGRYPKQFLVDAVRARRMDDEDDEGFVDEIEIVDDGKDNDGGEVVEKDEEDNKEKDNEDGEEINKIDERVEANGDVKMGSEVG